MSVPLINISKVDIVNHILKEIRAIEKDDHLNSILKFILDESNMYIFTMIMTLKEGLYMDIPISFELTVPENYPAPGNPIKGRCLDPISHPNVFEKGRLCLAIDNTGNLKQGFKESLEQTVMGIIYLFLHPANTTESTLNEHTKAAIIKNVEEYKNRKMVNITNSMEKVTRMKEFYSSEINDSLKKIKDWETFFPRKCYEKKGLSRYFISTLGGNKIMEMCKLENVISHIIHDQKFEFIQSSSIEEHERNANVPERVLLMKIKQTSFCTTLQYNPLIKKFNTNKSLSSLTFLDNKFLFNIEIKSNVKFEFIILNKNYDKNISSFHSIFKSEKINDNLHRAFIDQYKVDVLRSTFSDSLIHVDTDDVMPVWFKMECVIANFGSGMGDMLKNIAFRLQLDNESSPYLTTEGIWNRDAENRQNLTDDAYAKRNITDGSHLRILTHDELIMLEMNNMDDVTKEEGKGDLALATKYIATDMSQTGLDLKIASNRF